MGAGFGDPSRAPKLAAGSSHASESSLSGVKTGHKLRFTYRWRVCRPGAQAPSLFCYPGLPVGSNGIQWLTGTHTSEFGVGFKSSGRRASIPVVCSIQRINPDQPSSIHIFLPPTTCPFSAPLVEHRRFRATHIQARNYLGCTSGLEQVVSST